MTCSDISKEKPREFFHGTAAFLISTARKHWFGTAQVQPERGVMVAAFGKTNDQQETQQTAQHHRCGARGMAFAAAKHVLARDSRSFWRNAPSPLAGQAGKFRGLVHHRISAQCFGGA
jgi:hypothetical protein